MILLKTYNQLDPQWASKRLGSSTFTMADGGCYTSVEAMILSSTPKYASITPGDICDALNANFGYLDGMVNWDVLNRLFTDLFFYEREWTSNLADNRVVRMNIDEAIHRCKVANRQGLPVGLCVGLGVPHGRVNHIVCGYDLPDDTTKWKIKDPDGGRDIYFSDRYGSVEQNLMGFRTTVVPPVTFPDFSTDQDERDAQAMIAASMVVKGVNVGTYGKQMLDYMMG